MELLTLEKTPGLLESGEVYKMGYNHGYNCGGFFYLFDRIETIEEERPNGIHKSQRIFGAIFYDENEMPAHMTEFPDSYIYECDNLFCRGSGAEPVWLLEHHESCEDIPYTFYDGQQETIDLLASISRGE